MHNKAWFGCFLRQVACKIVHLKRKTAKRSRKCTVGLRFSNPPQTVKKSHQPSPFPTMVSILQPAISRPQVILLRPHAPIYKSDYQCINSKQFSLQHITKSQITISLIANHQPFYHRPLIGTPIRHGVYRGARYWDKPHHRYR